MNKVNVKILEVCEFLISISGVCPDDCGDHAECRKGECQCHEGWEGVGCQRRSCDPRCDHHGTCDDGTCVCDQGWQGTHCTLDGCPDACSGHGQCLKSSSVDISQLWTCRCDNGWTGGNCNIKLESTCNDGVDDDEGR